MKLDGKTSNEKRETESDEESFLVSALTEDNEFQTREEFMEWFNSRKKANKFSVTKIPFTDFDNWYFEEKSGDLVHKSGKFFKIRGLRSTTIAGTWDQPIIEQAEVGILGIITKKFNGIRYFLMQAKMEPGNINTIQLSPTVQATKSNYTQVHEGKKTKYLEYFIERDKSRIMVDQLQTEHGGRFWLKKNRNMIVDVSDDEEVEINEDFRWLTLGEIKELMEIDDFVNMDARSVLSCISFFDSELEITYNSVGKEDIFENDLLKKIPAGFKRELFISMIEKKGVNSMNDIINWLTNIKANTFLKSEDIGLKNVSRWIKTETEIKHESKKFFSVIGVRVEAGNREVQRWTQPLIEHYSHGFSGFLSKKINGVLHFLVQACLEPGSPYVFELIPTVLCYNMEIKIQNNESPKFLEYFKNASDKEIRHSCFQSDEGGRFFKSHYKSMIIELDESKEVKAAGNYIWVTLGQLTDLSRHNYLSLDTREVIASINFIGE